MIWPLQQLLANGDLDLAVLAHLQLPEDVEYEILYQDHYVHVVRHDHPSAGEALTLDSFCEIPQVFLGYGISSFDDLIDQTLAKTGRQRFAKMPLNSFAQIVQQLKHGAHAAVIRNRIAQQYKEDLCIRPLPFEFPNYHALVCWVDRACGDSGITWLRDQVLNVLKNVKQHA